MKNYKGCVCVVTGGRRFVFRKAHIDLLHRLRPWMVIEGGATGADGYARGFARDCQLISLTVNARWKHYGKRAGVVRNGEMLRLAERIAMQERRDLVVVAFPGGVGTANCVEQAVEMRIQVITVDNEGNPTETRR